MNTVLKISILTTGLGFAFAAQVRAASLDSYELTMARQQGDLSCQINPGSGGSASCHIEFKEQSHVAVTMSDSADAKGYVGVDKTMDGTVQDVLALAADPSKRLQSIVMLHSQSVDGKSFDAGISITDADALSAIHVAPMHMEIANDHSVTVKLSFVAYTPATSAITAHDQKVLVDQILQKIKPAIAAIQK